MSLVLGVDAPDTGLKYRSQWLGQPQSINGPTLVVCAAVAICVVGAASSFGILAGLGAILAVTLALVVLRYPVLGGYAVVALVPITSGLRRGFPVPGLRVSEALVAATAVLVLVPATRRATPRWNAVDWAGFAYAIGSVVIPVSNALARDTLTWSEVTSLLLPLQFFLIYRVVRTSLQNYDQRALAVRLLLLSSLAVSFLAIVQQLNIGPAREVIKSLTAADALDSYGYSVYARATGPFQHWHPLAGYLVVIALLAIALLADRNQKFLSRKWLAIVLAAAGSALMLSVTFVSMFGLVGGALIIGAKSQRLKQSLRWIIAGGAVALVAFGSYVFTRIANQYDNGVGGRRTSWIPQTLEYRVDVWRDQYLPQMDGRWLSGWGPGLPPDAAWSHTESVYVTLALRGGIPLLALFAVSMVAVLFLTRHLVKVPERRPLAYALAALVTVLWPMQLLFPYFTSSGMPQPFWVLVGIALAGWQMNTTSSKSRVSVD